MKTAIQEMAEWSYWVNNNLKSPIDAKRVLQKATELLEKEKQQIIDAYKDGFEENVRPRHEDAEEYFNEKFKP